MSVIIKGMEMPINCDECIYVAWSNFYQIYVCNAVRKDEPVLFNGKQVKSTAIVRGGRADNCPIIEVPIPHGDLIDRDAVIDLVMQYCPDDDGMHSKSGSDIREMLDEIEEMPTIIEAEGGT